MMKGTSADVDDDAAFAVAAADARAGGAAFQVKAAVGNGDRLACSGVASADSCTAVSAVGFN